MSEAVGSQGKRPDKIDCRKEGKRINNNTNLLLLTLGILVLLTFIPNNNHDTTVYIVITLQALNSLKEG
jgi:hypothetical protein